MELTPSPPPAGRQSIEGYGGDGFLVGGRLFHGSVLVLPDRTEDWPVRSMDEVTLASLRPAVEAPDPIEVLLLGCGPRMAMVAGDLRRELRAAGIVIEPMDTGAACRTYNLLLAEGRAVAAALIAVD